MHRWWICPLESCVRFRGYSSRCCTRARWCYCRSGARSRRARRSRPYTPQARSPARDMYVPWLVVLFHRLQLAVLFMSQRICLMRPLARPKSLSLSAYCHVTTHGANSPGPNLTVLRKPRIPVAYTDVSRLVAAPPRWKLHAGSPPPARHSPRATSPISSPTGSARAEAETDTPFASSIIAPPRRGDPFASCPRSLPWSPRCPQQHRRATCREP